MSLLTTIDNIPLFSTVEEAVAWGSTLNIVGFHSHVFGLQTGYMAGYNHQDIELSLEMSGISLSAYNNESASSQPLASESLPVQPPQTSTTTPPPPSQTNTGGGY